MRHARTRGPAYWDELYPSLSVEQRAEERIRRAATRATVAGVAAAAGASAAELATAGSEGWALPVTAPFGLLSVGADVLYATILQIELAFDVASIYGVPFAEDDVGEITTLLALPLGVSFPEDPEPEVAAESAPGPWRSVATMYGEGFADSVGSRLLQIGVARDLVPIAGILVSAVGNQMHFRRYTRHVLAAVRHRAAIVHACRRVGADVGAARLLAEGAWLMASGCGPVGRREALVFAMLIDQLPGVGSNEVHEAFGRDEDGWLARASELSSEAKDALLEVLVVVASADGELDTFERRFLQRVARALGRELDLFAVERHCARLREGEVPGSGDGAGRLPFGMAHDAR